MPSVPAKQTETGIPYGPCGFESLRISVRDKDRPKFPDGEFSPKLHAYLKRYVGKLNYLYCNYDGDSRWLQAKGLDDGSGFAGVVIHDMVKRLYWNYLNPKYAGDNTEVEAGGSYMPKWGVCEDAETLLQVIEVFLTTGTAWEGCQWVVTTGD